MQIAIITNKESSQIRLFDSFYCPLPYRLILCRARGFGAARNVAAKAFGDKGLMVMFNDDLVLSPKIWDFIVSVKRGEYAMQVEGPHVCSRVLVVHLEDYWSIGGCDESLRYYFEDGDFHIRAQKQGLKLRVVPAEYAKHIPHRHALLKPNLYVASEVARLMVKYQRELDSFSRYFVPFRYGLKGISVVVVHFLLRVAALDYWLLRSIVKHE